MLLETQPVSREELVVPAFNEQLAAEAIKYVGKRSVIPTLRRSGREYGMSEDGYTSLGLFTKMMLDLGVALPYDPILNEDETSVLMPDRVWKTIGICDKVEWSKRARGDIIIFPGLQPVLFGKSFKNVSIITERLGSGDGASHVFVPDRTGVITEEHDMYPLSNFYTNYDELLMDTIELVRIPESWTHSGLNPSR